ncbi:MAG: PIN domain-containing protein [Acidimicrobiales bacterium]
MTVLADTGVLVSAADSREPRHVDCAEVLRSHHGQMVMSAPVVAETSWMIESRLGSQAEARFLRLVTSGACRGLRARALNEPARAFLFLAAIHPACRRERDAGDA